MPPKRSKSQTGSAGGPPKWETGILTTPFVDVSRNVLVRTRTDANVGLFPCV